MSESIKSGNAVSIPSDSLDWGASERETVINVPARSQHAWIHTSDPNQARRLAKRPDTQLLEEMKDDRGAWTGATFVVPARSVLPLRAYRRVSDAQRAHLQRLAARRAAG